MKIVVLDGYALNPGDLNWEPLKAFGQVMVYDRTATEAEGISRIADAEIVLINKFPITESLLEACPSVRMIGVLATGYNVVDCAAARRRSIPVCNVPSYGTAAVTQFTMALILELCHRVALHNRSVRQHDWENCPDFCYWLTPQMELNGKTIGIIGFGRIGRAVGKLAKAFGMRVLACSPREYPEGLEIGQYVDLDTLLRQSDIVSLHCPLLPSTREIINAGTIEKMKDGAMLINTSRGPLVNEQDLADALESGKLRGAAVDVVAQEPIRADNPLLTTHKCIITPHIAWAPVESRQRLMDCVVSNVRAFLEGAPQNVVN